MLHHVGIEVMPEDVDRSIEFWQALDFVLVEPPATLRELTWLEREGTQIHLMPTEDVLLTQSPHVAVVAPEFERAIANLLELGFEVEYRRKHWGAERAYAITPSGHVVEVMAAPPPRQRKSG